MSLSINKQFSNQFESIKNLCTQFETPEGNKKELQEKIMGCVGQLQSLIHAHAQKTGGGVRFAAHEIDNWSEFCRGTAELSLCHFNSEDIRAFAEDFQAFQNEVTEKLDKAAPLPSLLSMVPKCIIKEIRKDLSIGDALSLAATERLQKRAFVEDVQFIASEKAKAHGVYGISPDNAVHEFGQRVGLDLMMYRKLFPNVSVSVSQDIEPLAQLKIFQKIYADLHLESAPTDPTVLSYIQSFPANGRNEEADFLAIMHVNVKEIVADMSVLGPRERQEYADDLALAIADLGGGRKMVNLEGGLGKEILSLLVNYCSVERFQLLVNLTPSPDTSGAMPSLIAKMNSHMTFDMSEKLNGVLDKMLENKEKEGYSVMPQKEWALENLLKETCTNPLLEPLMIKFLTINPEVRVTPEQFAAISQNGQLSSELIKALLQ